MLPAIWPAIKGLSLLQKILIPMGIVVLLGGLYWGWKEYQQSIGYKEHELETQVALTKQAEQTKEDMARQYAIVQHHAIERAEKIVALEDKLAAAKRRLAEYEKRTQTRVDVDAVRIVNELASVLNTIPAAEERAADPNPPAETASAPQVGCATVADLLRRNEVLTERLAKTMIGYHETWAYAKNKYAEEYLAYYGVPLPPDEE